MFLLIITNKNYNFSLVLPLQKQQNYQLCKYSTDDWFESGVNLSMCVLRVPAASVSAYRAAEVWKDFGNIVAIN